MRHLDHGRISAFCFIQITFSDIDHISLRLYSCKWNKGTSNCRLILFYFCSNFFKYLLEVNLRLFFLFVLVFSNLNTILQEINVKNKLSYILRLDFYPQRLVHGSPPITTRTGLPPCLPRVLIGSIRIWATAHLKTAYTVGSFQSSKCFYLLNFKSSPEFRRREWKNPFWRNFCQVFSISHTPKNNLLIVVVVAQKGKNCFRNDFIFDLSKKEEEEEDGSVQRKRF